MKKCPLCDKRRKNFQTCVACKTQWCWDCAQGRMSQQGPACPGDCQDKANAQYERTLAEVEKIRAERAKLPYIHPDLKRPPQENAP
jgi:hypothetical protein